MEETMTLSIAEVEEMIRAKQYSLLRRSLCELNAADIALYFDELRDELAILLFRILPKELAAEVFVDMDPTVQKLLIDAFSDYELRQVLGELYLDDTVDLIEEMPANVVNRILRNSTSADRKKINELLQYPDDSAGSIMTTEYVNLKENMTVDEAFELIRSVAIDKETIYTCFVTSADRKLVDALKSMLGIAAKVKLVAPKSITRSEGKAVRVIDKRKI